MKPRSERIRERGNRAAMFGGLAVTVAISFGCWAGAAYQSESATWLLAALLLCFAAVAVAMIELGSMAEFYRAARREAEWESRAPYFRKPSPN